MLISSKSCMAVKNVMIYQWMLLWWWLINLLSLKLFITFKILRNAQLILTIVMMMRTVQTPKDHFIVPVTMVTLEMEWHVMVSAVSNQWNFTNCFVK